MLTPRVIGAWLVERREQLAIPLQQDALIQPGLEIGPIELITAEFAAQPALPVQAAPECRSRRRRQKPDHRGRNRQAVDEPSLRLEDARTVRVEADDEPGTHLEAGTSEALHGFVGWHF